MDIVKVYPKYFPPRSKNLGYCTVGAESVNRSECFQKGY